MMTMPLTMATVGEGVRIREIRGGRRLRRRLADMGLNPGTRLQVIFTNRDGPLIVAVKDSRLAIGWGMAHRILVEAAGEPRQLVSRKHFRRGFRFRRHRFMRDWRHTRLKRRRHQNDE
jgi:ferrous iron transport protein A